MRDPGEDPRAQLRLHLERLASEGTWGLARGRAVEVEGDVPGVVGEESSPASASPAERAAPASVEAPAAADLYGHELTSYMERAERLADVESEALACTRCGLAETRKSVVFGVGDPRARLMFIGEGPGRDEDLQGEPFVGAAGKLLDRIIRAMGLERGQVYIANTVKCRPPRNRNPMPDELAACRSYLMRQVAAIRPEVIVLLGRVAAQAVLETGAPLGRLRGRFQEWCGIPVMCTYHPAYLLRKPEDKRKTWDDIQAVMGRLGLDEP